MTIDQIPFDDATTLYKVVFMTTFSRDHARQQVLFIWDGYTHGDGGGRCSWNLTRLVQSDLIRHDLKSITHGAHRAHHSSENLPSFSS